MLLLSFSHIKNSGKSPVQQGRDILEHWILLDQKVQGKLANRNQVACVWQPEGMIQLLSIRKVNVPRAENVHSVAGTALTFPSRWAELLDARASPSHKEPWPTGARGPHTWFRENSPARHLARLSLPFGKRSGITLDLMRCRDINFLSPLKTDVVVQQSVPANRCCWTTGVVSGAFPSSDCSELSWRTFTGYFIC